MNTKHTESFDTFEILSFIKAGLTAGKANALNNMKNADNPRFLIDHNRGVVVGLSIAIESIDRYLKEKEDPCQS